MQSTARDHYLFTEVKTATPEKLQLLLIEGALTLANRARQFWQQGCNDRALRALLEAQSIVAHMLAVIDHEAAGDLAKRVSAIYEFIFRSLVKAGHRHDEKSLGDAIRILEIERETWRQVCDKLARNAPQATFGDALEGVPPALHSDQELLSQTGGFSVEA
jgi:flagellar protein FliS